jgi:predicted kinase
MDSTQHKKSLILLRGLPGSGKSTLGIALSENGKYPVFSVDDYFTKSGNYNFEFDKNHLAYKQCEQSTSAALQAGIEKVFVANTFTMDWEIEPYFKMASENHYSVFVITVEKYHNGSNVHEIPDDQIRKMAEKYQVKLY